MGGGDLNLKKSWHPATFRNQERVWKKEHEAKEEKKKLEQLLKDREMERQFQELQKLSGIKKSTERIEWMYAAGPSLNEEFISQEREAYLLGERSVTKILDSKGEIEELNNSKVLSDGFTSYGLSANSQKDMKAKVLEDPLYAIIKKEQSMIQSLLDNKYKLKQIRRDITEKGVATRHGDKHSSSSKSHSSRKVAYFNKKHKSKRHGYEHVDKGDYYRHKHRSHDR